MSEPDRSDRFNVDPLGTVITQCSYCVHLADGPFWACAAFPGHVPPEILQNRFDHRRQYPGDDGVQFELRPDLDQDGPTIQALFRYLDASHSAPMPPPSEILTDAEVASAIRQSLNLKPE